jgi:acetoin utilization deacetylase AcuC-like enzyme
VSRPLVIRHPSSLRGDDGPPERPARVAAVEAALAARDWLGWERREAPCAVPDVLCAVHPPAYLEALRATAAAGGMVGGDTVVDARSLDGALHAAGGACLLAEALLAGEAPTGFALGRPPGHHAGGPEPMGFCLLNSVAVAARHALDTLGAERVMIVDWDVHHGNGTHDVFRRSDRVLFASIHEAGLWPGTGDEWDLGAEEGRGYAIHLPVPAGTDPDVWLSLVEHVVVPAGEAFAPDLVLVSAGFDAHRADPLAGSQLETETFAELARHVRDLGARVGAPVGAVLEGGYDPAALADSVVATMKALAGDGTAGSVAPDPVHTARAAARVAEFWEL